MGVIDNVVELRKKLGYSQEEIADKLGISRQTYSKIENKESSLNMEQLEILSDFFGIPAAEFFFGVENTEKFKQMYLYILKNFQNGGLTKTKLAKLLYLVDFNHFYNYLEPMSGALYKCKEYGPLADSFLEMTDSLYEEGQIKIDCLSMGAQMISIPSQLDAIDYGLLSEDDKKEIDDVCNKWADANTQTIVNFTHHQKPWMSCRLNEVIPYELILQEDPDHVY